MKTLYKRIATLFALTALVYTVFNAAAASAAGSTANGVVNINTASVQQLQLLDGIGSSKAKAIIAYRDNQRFKSADDLLNVKGIGQKLLTKIKARVAVTGKTTLIVASKKKPGKKTKTLQK
jgi:competence protein ComEA